VYFNSFNETGEIDRRNVAADHDQQERQQTFRLLPKRLVIIIMAKGNLTYYMLSFN